jgi:hypothetical protein
MSSRLIPQSRGWLKAVSRRAAGENAGSSAQAPGGKDDSHQTSISVRALFTRERSKRLHGPSIRDRLRPGWRRFPPWLDIIDSTKWSDGTTMSAQRLVRFLVYTTIVGTLGYADVWTQAAPPVPAPAAGGAPTSGQPPVVPAAGQRGRGFVPVRPCRPKSLFLVEPQGWRRSTT